nr:MAG TPA: hypothetical protein [Bacteriophage sp.]
MVSFIVLPPGLTGLSLDQTGRAWYTVRAGPLVWCGARIRIA